ncbi:hypothetical protein AAFF_G00261060 [Aldrovandia affinis]|uniref:Cell division control protein 6 homolog n=1 Tax=Aldrovandia affinis TaxID=143900 RepID=A0AAD7W3A5_9TELE|nr:hypothetical protein AAFF_G00261060 [Aldrovandia affinis]
MQPMGGLFQGGVPKLRPVGDGSVGRSALHPPGSRPAAPRPPGSSSSSSSSSSGPGRMSDSDVSSLRASPPEGARSHRPSLPDISKPPSSSSSSSAAGGMKHSSSAPPPPINRRGNAPPAPHQKTSAPSYNREKPLPPTPGHRGPPPPMSGRDSAPPPPVKPPPSPLNTPRPVTGGGSSSSSSSSSSSLAPPPPPYRQPPGAANGPSSPVNEAAPELPQRHNSLHKKIPSNSHTPARAHAPPPPPSPSPQGGRPPPPAREPPGRGAAPPVPPPMIRNGGRDAPPPPPPYRMHSTVTHTSSDTHSRGKPPPPPSRTPAGPPPPPPPIRNGHISISKSLIDDFESKYSFHPVEDFPPPEEYRNFQKVYPSKTNRVVRGAPPLPPVGRKVQRGAGREIFPINKYPYFERNASNSTARTRPKMPSTRSQSQLTLTFPKRKSSRASARPKDPTQSERKSVGLADSTTRSATHLQPLSPRPAVLPLSPRKRTGDENGCNLPPALLGSPPKQMCPPLSSPLPSPRKLNFDENTPVFSPPSKELASPKRHLADPVLSKPRSPLGRAQPTPGSSSARLEKRGPAVRLFSREESPYHSVKQALHTAIPERLLSRDEERASISSFLTDKVKPGLPSSLYISGAPGTGKTACLNCVLQEMEDQLRSIKKVVINCMTLRNSQAIFPLIAERLGASGGHSDRRLEKLLTSTGPTVLLVLDEMDQLDSKGQDVLYTIFEWPYLPESRLCLIGIANALDLTDRILPRLQARPHCRPLLLNFRPYSRQELTAIVQDRLTQVSGEAVLDAAAVQFCARKVSAVSGDARKALDICRRAVEIVESDARSRKTPGSPASDPKGSRVSLPQVARVLSEVYGDRMAAGGGEGESFPLQQKLLVCCLLLLTRQGKSREVTLGKLHEVYSRLCTQRQVGGVAQGECMSLCSLLESRGIFSLKKAKEARLTKVSLKIEERDVENALKDRTLLGSILSAGLP